MTARSTAPGRCGSRRRRGTALQPDLAEKDTFAKLGLDGLRRPPGGGDLDLIAAGAFREAVEFEVAEIVAHQLGDRRAVVQELHRRALDAIDAAARCARQRAADEAG